MMMIQFGLMVKGNLKVSMCFEFKYLSNFHYFYNVCTEYKYVHKSYILLTSIQEDLVRRKLQPQMKFAPASKSKTAKNEDRWALLQPQ